uniref:DNA mismatch repair protein n=1 Tax=uncultured microorganism TaxID=358574 RepID=I3PGA4_9ZZZZ|nr:DNA mismatch repair protein [uncultured microorganism]
MKTNKLSLLFPDQDRVTYEMISEETWHDLGLDAVTEKVAAKPQEVPMIQQVMRSLTPDPAVTAFRCGVFEDILHHPEIREKMAKLLDKVKMFYDYGVVRRHENDESGVWDLMHRLEEYHDYIIAVEQIRECLADQDLKSEGMLNLREAVETIYRDNGFAGLRKDVEEMRVTASAVKSLTVGINLNDRFEAINLGLVSVNAKPFTRSGLLKNFLSSVNPKDEIEPEADWNGSTSYYPANAGTGLLEGFGHVAESAVILRNPLAMLSLARVPEADGSSAVPRQMDSAATMLTSRITRKLRDTLGKYLNISVKDISDLIPELTFYTRWAEYIEKRRAEGWTFCTPRVRETPGKDACTDAKGFYNLKLIAAEKPERVVRNDLAFDAEKRVYILTGANRGGKTTITQAVGQLFLLAQSGISVPAEAFDFDPADRILTHFPADEDKTLDLGRLGEECRRFRDLFEKSSGRSLLLLNETFSTTSFEEGYFIAVDAVKAILSRGTRTIYNTHMHKLAKELDTEINEAGRTGRAVSLVAETREGKNSFRVRIAPPEGKSFAREIAVKYGVTYDALTGKR